jgi:hypothetical protein
MVKVVGHFVTRRPVGSVGFPFQYDDIFCVREGQGNGLIAPQIDEFL